MKIKISREEILKLASNLKSQKAVNVEELDFEINIVSNQDFFLTKSTKQNLREVIGKVCINEWENCGKRLKKELNL